MSPIVESPDGLDFDIGGNANKIGPGVSYNDNPEELLDTIDVGYPLDIVLMVHLSL